jgi:hypothetical protein
MSIIPNDHLYGSYEFATDVTKDDQGIYTAKAQGYSASHRDQGQALNDLNQKLAEAIQMGKLTPNY